MSSKPDPCWEATESFPAAATWAYEEAVRTGSQIGLYWCGTNQTWRLRVNPTREVDANVAGSALLVAVVNPPTKWSL